MILVDTSIWIDHLHRPEPDLSALLNDERVATHPMIIGELALGSIRSRSEVIGLLTDLPTVVVATNSECLQLVEPAVCTVAASASSTPICSLLSG